MAPDPTTPLAELVTLRPELAPVFDRMGLDFCCGGGQTLAEAAGGAGLVVEDLIALLAEVEPEPQPDWTSLGPVALVDHLEATHHRFLRDQLPYLGGLGEKVLEVHGARHPELAAIVATFGELCADLEPHLAEEERVLFPMVRELSASDGGPDAYAGALETIGVLSVEHDRVGELLARLRELTDDYEPPADGCASYRALFAGLAELEADTHLHVHKENNVLFPAVVAQQAGR